MMPEMVALKMDKDGAMLIEASELGPDFIGEMGLLICK